MVKAEVDEGLIGSAEELNEADQVDVEGTAGLEVRHVQLRYEGRNVVHVCAHPGSGSGVIV